MKTEIENPKAFPSKRKAMKHARAIWKDRSAARIEVRQSGSEWIVEATVEGEK
jgi:hypothetical protein